MFSRSFSFPFGSCDDNALSKKNSPNFWKYSITPTLLTRRSESARSEEELPLRPQKERERERENCFTFFFASGSRFLLAFFWRERGRGRERGREKRTIITCFFPFLLFKHTELFHFLSICGRARGGKKREGVMNFCRKR